MVGQKNGIMVFNGACNVECQFRGSIGGIGGQGDLFSGKSHQIVHGGNFPVQACKGGGIGGVGVNHGIDVLSLIIQCRMKSELAGRAVAASLVGGTVGVQKNNIFGAQKGVFNAAWCNGNALLLSVETAYISPGTRWSDPL